MEDMSRLHKLLLLILSTDQRNESATGIEMLVATLKRDGKDIHWFADRLIKGSGSASYGITMADVQAAYQRGYKAGQEAGGGNGGGGWQPEQAGPATWDGPDPVRDSSSKMPPQKWAAWMLARRRHKLSQWEADFCESVAAWLGTPTDKQKAVLERIIFKVW